MEQWPLLLSLRNVPTLHEEVPPLTKNKNKKHLTTFSADALTLSQSSPFVWALEGLGEHCY